jgi:hypothetical protein
MLWVILGFVAFLIIYTVFLAVAFNDIWHYGYAGDASKLMIIVYMVLVLVVAIGTIYFIIRT